MISFHRLAFAATLLGLTLTAAAQGVLLSVPPPPPPGSGGTVTGTVLLGDTQHGARFAQVMLQKISTDDTEQQQRSFGVSGAKTSIDGTFTIANAAPGDYYVLAFVPGYISERSLLQAQLDAGASPTDILSQIPTVHLTPGGSSSVTVTMQRGATISGRLQWEDGSAATGIRVTATVVPPATTTLTPQSQSPLSSLRGFGQNASETDDRGGFRLTGLTSGDYLLQAVVNPDGGFGSYNRSRGSNIQIYAPGVFHKAEAKPITVRAGDERGDANMVLDLHGLRTVSGHVSTSAAGLSVLSGRASLSDTTDPTINANANLLPNDDFTIPYVPPGTYTLTVTGSTNAAPTGFTRNRGGQQNTTTGTAAFKPYTQTLTISDTDITNLNVNLASASQ